MATAWVEMKIKGNGDEVISIKSMETGARKRRTKSRREILENNWGSQEIFGWDPPCASWECICVTLLILHFQPCPSHALKKGWQSYWQGLAIISQWQTQWRRGSFTHGPHVHSRAFPSHRSQWSLLQTQQTVCICHLLLNYLSPRWRPFWGLRIKIHQTN